jgi:hypothetical protein
MLQCHAVGKFHFAFQCVGDSLRMKEWMCVDWSRTRFFYGWTVLVVWNLI